MKEGVIRLRFVQIIAPIVLLSGILAACGPTQKEIAEREKWQTWFQEQSKAKALRVENMRVTLRSRNAERVAAGMVSPTKVPDPGYPVAECIRPKPHDDTFTISTATGKTGFDVLDAIDPLGPVGTDFVCGNTKAGAAIVEWRKWYCEGSSDLYACVLAKWEDGEPTFGPYVQGRRVVRYERMGRGAVEIEIGAFNLR
jgi:hypothetical protein